MDLWQALGRFLNSGGFVVNSIIKPKLGLEQKPFCVAYYALWQPGIFIKNDVPQGQMLRQVNVCTSKVCSLSYFVVALMLGLPAVGTCNAIVVFTHRGSFLSVGALDGHLLVPSPTPARQSNGSCRWLG